jgi:hypothetical protein
MIFFEYHFGEIDDFLVFQRFSEKIAKEGKTAPKPDTVRIFSVFLQDIPYLSFQIIHMLG